MSKKEVREYTKEEIDKLYEEDYFYNHGENPAFKKFMEITSANHFEGKQLDYRTFAVRKGTKFFLARDWEDFIQRDLRCENFVRAGCLWGGQSVLMYAGYKWYNLFLPIGTRGISKVAQTSFFQAWGPVGVIGINAVAALSVYLYWKTSVFTAKKFYQHVILGERHFYYERMRWQPGFGNYYFKDDPLSCEESVPDIAKYEMARGTWPKPEWNWGAKAK